MAAPDPNFSNAPATGQAAFLYGWNDDAGEFRGILVDASGKVLVSTSDTASASTATRSDVAASASTVTLLTADPSRVSVIIHNDSAATCKIRYGAAAASATDFTVVLLPGETLIEDAYTGEMRAIWTSATGNARIYYDTGSAVEQVGSFFRAGVADSGNNAGVLRQGGFVIGGEGPGVNGTLLRAQHPSWVDVIPQRGGSAVEVQIYNTSNSGLAVTVNGTAYIDATSGSFASSAIEAGDVIGYGFTLYKIKDKVSNTRLELETLAGGAVTFSGATTETFYHAYYYADGVCDTNGTSVTWVSGDYFFTGAALSGQHRIKIDGTYYFFSSFVNERAITIGSSAGTQTGVAFTQKFFSLARNTSLFRIQALSGGIEENLAIYHRVDGRWIFASQAAKAAGAHYRPFVFQADANYDAPATTEIVHLTLSQDGRLGLGKDYTTVGWPTSAKMHVWRDPRLVHVDDGSNDTLLLDLHSTHNGAGARHMVFGGYNNKQAGYIQGWADDALTVVSPITLNPKGGSVGIGTGTQSVLPSALSVFDNTSANASVGYPLTLQHKTTGSPGTGIGVGIAFRNETADDNIEIVGSLDFVATDVTGGSEDTDFVVQLQAAGGALAQKFRVLSTGIIQFGTHSAIGAETITGFMMIKDAAGNDRKVAIVS